MAGRGGGSCAPTPDAIGATGGGVSAVAVAEGVTATLEGAGSAEGPGRAGALADVAGVLGRSGMGLGSQPPRASAATESSAAAWEVRLTPQNTHEASVERTCRWQRGQGTKDAIAQRYGHAAPAQSGACANPRGRACQRPPSTLRTASRAASAGWPCRAR